MYNFLLNRILMSNMCEAVNVIGNQMMATLRNEVGLRGCSNSEWNGKKKNWFHIFSSKSQYFLRY